MPKLMRRSGFDTQEISNLMSQHYRPGYLPHFRYGDYVLSYIAPSQAKGVRYRHNVETFDYPSEREARKAEIAKSYTMSSGARRGVKFDEFQILRDEDGPEFVHHAPGALARRREDVQQGRRDRGREAGHRHRQEDGEGIRIMGNFAKGRLAHRRGRLGWSRNTSGPSRTALHACPSR
ncbi:MAG: hypothetical protein MZV49_24370 [Rhodopseudomonas palustris]|nr:hypothetical protein [Rhodopseudomonas palustris]